MKSQKLALHSLKNKDQGPITWNSKQYIETQLTQLNYPAKNEKNNINYSYADLSEYPSLYGIFI